MSQQEQTELRRLLGGLGWKCEQIRPQHSATTGFQHSRIEQTTVQDMTEEPTDFSNTSRKKVDKPLVSSVFPRKRAYRAGSMEVALKAYSSHVPQKSPCTV